MLNSETNKKVILKGNEAIAETALRSACTAYFGYPITPQNELIAYMSANMANSGGVFIQAESELAAINMVNGAAAAGARAMTSSSSPGVSLMQEGISYICAADLPCVIVNVSRAGPGLGGIVGAQGDYYQSTRGGGHGDYHHIVLAPSSVQEAADLTRLAFDLADKWRMPAMILIDGIIGQMAESLVLPPKINKKDLPVKAWAVGSPSRQDGAWSDDINNYDIMIDGSPTQRKGVKHITSCILDHNVLENLIIRRFARYKEIANTEVKFSSLNLDKSNLILVAYGAMARVCEEVVNMAAEEGFNIGLLKLLTLWPFPSAEITKLAKNGKSFLVVEMSMGQMIDDVKMAALQGAFNAKVDFYGRVGGIYPNQDEVLAHVISLLKTGKLAETNTRIFTRRLN